MPTIAIPALYRSLHEYLMQRIPDECDSRLTNMIWLMMGIFQARSVQLNLAARKVPIRAKQLNIVKRFGRFLNNAALRVRDWTSPPDYGCQSGRAWTSPAEGQLGLSSAQSADCLDMAQT